MTIIEKQVMIQCKIMCRCACAQSMPNLFYLLFTIEYNVKNKKKNYLETSAYSFKFEPKSNRTVFEVE